MYTINGKLHNDIIQLSIMAEKITSLIDDEVLNNYEMDNKVTN